MSRSLGSWREERRCSGPLWAAPSPHRDSGTNLAVGASAGVLLCGTVGIPGLETQKTTCNDLQCSRKARKSSLNWNQEKIWRQSQKFFTCAQRQPLGGLEAAALSPELSFGLCLILKASKQGGCWCSLTASVWLEECLERGHLSAPAMHDQSVISCNTQSLLFSPSHSNPGLDLANY